VRDLLSLLDGRRWIIGLGIGLALVASALEGLGLSLLIPFIQSINALGHEHEGLLPRLLAVPFRHLSDSHRPFAVGAAVAISLVLKAAVGYAASVLFAWLSNTAGHELRVRRFEQLLYLHFDYLERLTWGRVINTIASDTWRTAEALGVLSGLIRGACVVLVFGALLLALSWQLTLVVVFALSVISMIATAITRKGERLGRAALISNNRFADRMYDAIGGLKVIRSFATERSECETFVVASERVARDFLRVNMLSNLGGPVFEVLSGFVLIGRNAVMRTALVRQVGGYDASLRSRGRRLRGLEASSPTGRTEPLCGCKTTAHRVSAILNQYVQQGCSDGQVR
jgi:ATP-binding cassette, subfamily B, bacterial MsbA